MKCVCVCVSVCKREKERKGRKGNHHMIGVAGFPLETGKGVSFLYTQGEIVSWGLSTPNR